MIFTLGFVDTESTHKEFKTMGELWQFIDREKLEWESLIIAIRRETVPKTLELEKS